MVCITHNCNNCTEQWVHKTEQCPKCNSEDIFTECDEDGDFDNPSIIPEYEKNPER